MGDYLNYVYNMAMQCMDNFSFSAILATITTAFVEYTGGDYHAICIWLIFSFVDCVLGVVRAVVFREFSTSKLYKWFFKIGTQIVLILLFAMMLDLLHTATGIELMLTNWLVLFFAFFDFSTCIDKLVSMNAPVPSFLLYILSLLRHRVARATGTAIGADEDEIKNIEDAMDPSKHRKDS